VIFSQVNTSSDLCSSVVLSISSQQSKRHSFFEEVKIKLPTSFATLEKICLMLTFYEVLPKSRNEKEVPIGSSVIPIGQIITYDCVLFDLFMF
jgi:hypothetical protein